MQDFSTIYIYALYMVRAWDHNTQHTRINHLSFVFTPLLYTFIIYTSIKK